MTAIALLPEDHAVKFCKEPISGRTEGVCWLFTAYVFQIAPEEGWPSRGAYFGHPPDSQAHQEPCPRQWKHDDRVFLGINAHPDQPEVIERLLIDTINERWGKK